MLYDSLQSTKTHSTPTPLSYHTRWICKRAPIKSRPPSQSSSIAVGWSAKANKSSPPIALLRWQVAIWCNAAQRSASRLGGSPTMVTLEDMSASRDKPSSPGPLASNKFNLESAWFWCSFGGPKCVAQLECLLITVTRTQAVAAGICDRHESRGRREQARCVHRSSSSSTLRVWASF